MLKSSNDFLKLALLTNDSTALFLAAVTKENSKEDRKAIFCFEDYDQTLCKQDFRFEKADILRLKSALGIPDAMKNSDGSKFAGLEGLCVLLKRLAYPNRLFDLKKTFGRGISELSMISNTMLDFVFVNFSQLLTSVDQWWLNPNHLAKYSSAIRTKGSPLGFCCGFIDGTLNPICRPKKNQKGCYSGHKRTHGLKYQAIVIPNGLIANLYGPIPGRRHDSHMLKESHILDLWENKLSNLVGCPKYYFYGDSGYPLETGLLTPYFGNFVTPTERRFNKSMSSLRVCVEWEFGGLLGEFAFLDFKKNQKLFLQPLSKQFIVATILKNCLTCLYGSQTSTYFGVLPPSLESYLSNIE